jgi:hypothetical protein
MEQHSSANINQHLWVVAQGLAVVTFLMGGMIGLMAVLVYDGLWASVSSSPIGGIDYGSFLSHAAPVVLLSYLLVGGFFARWYRRYAKKIRQDPSQMIDF